LLLGKEEGFRHTSKPMNMTSLSLLAAITPMLAEISGDSLIHALVALVIWGIILWVLWWGLGRIAPPEPFMKIGTVVLVLLTVVVLINILLGIAGRPFIRW
jgi:heme A synthase